MVGIIGLEPIRFTAQEPKSCVSAYSTISPKRKVSEVQLTLLTTTPTTGGDNAQLMLRWS